MRTKQRTFVAPAINELTSANFPHPIVPCRQEANWFLRDQDDLDSSPCCFCAVVCSFFLWIIWSCGSWWVCRLLWARWLSHPREIGARNGKCKNKGCNLISCIPPFLCPSLLWDGSDGRRSTGVPPWSGCVCILMANHFRAKVCSTSIDVLHFCIHRHTCAAVLCKPAAWVYVTGAVRLRLHAPLLTTELRFAVYAELSLTRLAMRGGSGMAFSAGERLLPRIPEGV